MSTQAQRPYARQLDFSKATRTELISMCLRNAANSFRTFAMEGETKAAQGKTLGKTDTGPSWEAYIGNVLVLAVHIPHDWQVESENFKDAWEKIGIGLKENQVQPIAEALDLHHIILELLDSRGYLLDDKVPRSLID